MTTIRFVEEDGRCTLTVEGHAGYAVSGQDIVCAGISTLVCTLNGCLSEEYERARLSHFEADLDSGEARLCWQAEPEYADRIRCIWDTIEEGFLLMAGHYPAYVEMEG